MDIGLKTVKRFINNFGSMLTETDLEEIRFGKSSPQATYAFTKDEPGTR